MSIAARLGGTARPTRGNSRASACSSPIPRAPCQVSPAAAARCRYSLTVPLDTPVDADIWRWVRRPLEVQPEDLSNLAHGGAVPFGDGGLLRALSRGPPPTRSLDFGPAAGRLPRWAGMRA